MIRRLPALFAVAALAAPPTDVRAATPTGRDRSVFVGAVAGAFQLARPDATARLRDTGRVGLYLSVLGLDHAMHAATPGLYDGSLATARAIVASFAGTGAGIIEGDLDAYNTPSVPAQDFNSKGADDWRVWAAQVGWAPSIFMLNQNARGSGSTTQLTKADVQDVVTATSDIRRLTPSIRRVLTYISPNTGIYPPWATGRYWSTARTLALRQGGFGIDVPVGYFLLSPVAYRQVVEEQIIWARQHHLLVAVLLSPFSTDAADCRRYPISRGICQFSPDPHMMRSAQQVVRQLHAGGADPTIWIVDNYSEQAVSPFPGTDDTKAATYHPNTILAVATWIAGHAPTSPFPADAVGLQSPTTGPLKRDRRR